MTQQLQKVNFDLIRYANCWEDPEILLEGLDPGKNSRILSIASAGDNSFSLLTREPELVVAVDLSKVQLNLVELKKAAITILKRKEYLEFIGFLPSDSRMEVFQSLKSHLSKEAVEYWEHHQELIQLGVINQGKFEKYFQLFVNRILPLIHSRNRVEALFAPKNMEEQQSFYYKKWNNLRWRLLFKIFFSKRIMGRVGRDPEFLRQVNIPVSQFIFQMAERELSHTKAQENFILFYTLNGKFGEYLPHYVQEGNYELVQANLSRLKLFEGTAERALKEFGGISHMNLSDIFEYMDEDLFKSVAEQLRDHSAPNSRIAYWNLMVPREISHILPDDFSLRQSDSESLSLKDKGFFYRKFLIDQKL
ncbi:MAG: BtaA family protein [Bacteroidia bacterium]|nr:BtaA family protein [Bacteroidia bacterium]